MKLTVFLDSGKTEAWKWKIIQELQGCGDLDITYVSLKLSGLDRVQAFLTRAFHWPYFLYETIDRAIFSKKSHIKDAFCRVDSTLLRATGSFLEIAAGSTFDRRLASPLRRTLKNLQSDLFLDLTRETLPKSLMHLPRFGTWSVQHGDRKEYFGVPAFFWEMYDRKAASGVVLQFSMGDCEVERILYRSYSRTHLYSLFLSRNEAYWKATAFVKRRLDTLLKEGWEGMTQLETYRELPASAGKPRKWPSFWQMLVFLGKIAARFVHEKQENASKYQFELAYKPKSATFMNASPSQYTVLKPPRSEFWADPFLFKHQGKTYLFFENYPYAEKKGLISCMELSEDGRYPIPELVLERDYHLSYPFLLSQGDEIYMIPETSGNRTIELYRAVEFPRRWTLEKTLMENVNAHDTTVFFKDGKYWMFTNIVTAGGSVNDELFLFYSDSLFGEWIPHPKNPVVSDVSTARPAGQLFYHQGRLIRPSQDCSKRYGYAVNFNQVEILSETDYRERLLHKMVPDGYLDYKGVHTYNTSDEYEVIDLGRYSGIPKNATPASAERVQPVPLPVLDVPLAGALQPDAVSVN